MNISSRYLRNIIQTELSDYEDLQTLKNNSQNPIQNISTNIQEKPGKIQYENNNISNEIDLLLKSLGYKPTEDNKDMIKALIKNNFPVNEENLKNLNRAIKLTEDNSIEKGIFLLKNDFQINSKTASIIDGYSSGKIKIDNQITELFENLMTSLSSNKNILPNIIKFLMSPQHTNNSNQNININSAELQNIFNEFSKTEMELQNIISKTLENIQIKSSKENIKSENLNNKNENIINDLSQNTSNTELQKNKELTFEKFAFTNKEIIVPALIKSIKNNSPEKFMDFIKNMGFKNDIPENELNSVVKMLLWDKPEIRNDSNSFLEQIKNISKVYEKGEHIDKNVDKNILQSTTNVTEDEKIIKEFIQNNKDFLIDEMKNNIKDNSTKSFELKFYDSLKKSFSELSISSEKILSYPKEKIFKMIFDNSLELVNKITELSNRKTALAGKIAKSFSIDIDNNPEKIDEFINSLSDKINEIKNSTPDNIPNYKEIIKSADNITNNIEFMMNTKDIMYLQLPININDNNTTAELYVFNNKKNKKSNSSSASALLSLDFAFLGHIEAYIQKQNKNIYCQFRMGDSIAEKIISKNINKLGNILKEHGYNLEQVNFKKTSDRFSIISEEPDIFTKKNKNNENFNLDIRT